MKKSKTKKIIEHIGWGKVFNSEEFFERFLDKIRADVITIKFH